MPTKVVFRNEQAAQEFWAANEAPRESRNKHFTFSTDEYDDHEDDDDDEYFSVASSECYPSDIPEFITIDLNDILVVTYKPRRGLKTTLKATRDALRKVAVKSRTASSRPPSATKSTNKRIWFRKRQQKSRKSPSTTEDDDVGLSIAIDNNS